MSYPLEPFPILLGDGKTTSNIYPVSSEEPIPTSLVSFLCEEYNNEILQTLNTPYSEAMDLDEFRNYWFGGVAGIMLLGGPPNAASVEEREWEKECLGAFFIKQHFPGRSSHICTGDVIVNAGIRRKGIGGMLMVCLLEWSARLDYKYVMFNLIYENNVIARKLLEGLDFTKVGRIKQAGAVFSGGDPVDALIYGRPVVQQTEDDPESALTSRFERIRIYLLTRTYPAGADRLEKARLRNACRNYSVRGSKLFMADREVIVDPYRQTELASLFHKNNHNGINKTTTLLAVHYYWPKMKETCGLVIKNCEECREASALESLEAQRKRARLADIDNGGIPASERSEDQSLIMPEPLTFIDSEPNMPEPQLFETTTPGNIHLAPEDLHRHRGLQ